ncbi:MAG: MltA domain-containing protein [Desulfobulbus sp.]
MFLLHLCVCPAPAASRIADDLDRQSLSQALLRSLSYLNALPPDTRFRFARTEVPVTRLIDTARHLRDLVLSSLDDPAFQRQVARDFIQLPCLSSPGSPLLITGYYQPVFQGSLHREPPFLHPLYSPPGDLVVRRRAGRKPVIGRLAGGRLQPYWTRREIEQGRILQGGELVWLRDPFDAFTLHVQGSGIIRLADGSLRGVHYARSNGRTYTSIGTFLVKTGRMRLADVTMDSIRTYLERHPHEVELILHQNDAFIFFEWSSPGPALGSLNQPLTPGRSVAADQRIYPPGSVLLVKSRRPVMDRGQVAGWKPMQRLLTVQDTGSAINGPERLDIFWGTGERAGLEAGQMKETGDVVLLLVKEPALAAP